MQELYWKMILSGIGKPGAIVKGAIGKNLTVLLPYHQKDLFAITRTTFVQDYAVVSIAIWFLFYFLIVIFVNQPTFGTVLQCDLTKILFYYHLFSLGSLSLTSIFFYFLLFHPRYLSKHRRYFNIDILM